VSEPELRRIVEAVLQAANEPVGLDRLIEIAGGAPRGDVRTAIDALNEEYETAGHAFSIVEIAGGYQFYCRPEYAKWIRELHKGRMPTRLSQAALETLAIVAYKQPIVRAEIEIIRGVDSSGVLATLMKRNLITIAGRAPGMGRALLYRTTCEFLRYFGLETITDLPRLEEFAEVLGLRPEELALAVGGAEALSGVGGRHDVEAEDVPAGDGDLEELPRGEEEPVPDEEACEEPAVSAGERADATVPVQPGARSVESSAAAQAEPPARVGEEPPEPAAGGESPEAAIIRSVPVPERRPGENGHRLRDEDLIDPLDEA
jgi:segregation and condensation protein B